MKFLKVNLIKKGLLIIVFIHSSFAFSQNIVVKNVVGFCETNDLVPLETIKNCAFEKALINAFEKSGVQLEVQSKFIESLVSEDGIVKSKYIFDIQSKYLNSNIIDYKNLTYKQKGKYLFAYIETVTIIKYETKSDAEFSFTLNGISNIYKDGENLSFTFNPHKNGFLNIFYIENENAYKLFPSEDEKENYFEKNQKYSFPRNEYIDYTLTSSENEDNILVFIFTKWDINYEDEFSEKKLYKEIYSIQRNQRTFEFFQIKILNQ